MIGKKLYKGQYTNKEYAKVALWCNKNNAKLVNKDLYYEVEEITISQKQKIENEILNLKNQLKNTDWINNKINDVFFTEGNGNAFKAIKEKYKEILLQRKTWREKINELENKEK